jgi:hypothetical protein
MVVNRETREGITMKTFEGNNGLTYLWEEGSDTIQEVESTMIYELESPDEQGVNEFLSWL